MTASVYHLLPYQRRFIEDPARFKLGLFSRQCGKSFCTSLMAVDDALARPGVLWVCLSAGERQSREWMQKVRQHLAAAKAVAEFSEIPFRAETAQLSCTLPNGSRIIGLPANPDTARGYSANVILDEFAFHEDSRAIWRALVPTVTRGYRLAVVSTPNGTGNQFHELCCKDAGKVFSKHKVTIYDAVKDGLDADVPALRAALDEESFRQEFLCEFLDEAGAWLPYELIAANEAEPPSILRDPARCGDLYLGFDVARTHDLSVIWVSELAAGRHVARQVVVLRKTPFAEQRRILYSLLELPNCRRCCIDASGLGMQLAEEAAQRFGTWKVEPVRFSMPVNEALAGRLKAAMEDRAVLVPADREIREALHKIRKTATLSGNVRFVAESDAAGHADHFWALALALQAASGADAGPAYMEPAAKAAAPAWSLRPDHSDDLH